MKKTTLALIATVVLMGICVYLIDKIESPKIQSHTPSKIETYSPYAEPDVIPLRYCKKNQEIHLKGDDGLIRVVCQCLGRIDNSGKVPVCRDVK